MILLTGATGFIGKEIVIIFDKLKIKYEIFDGDITNIDTVEQYMDNYKIVLHMASVITHRELKDKELFRKVNVEGTRNLLKKFTNAHFVYISTKDVERNILTTYAKSKLEAEDLVLKNQENLVIRLPSIFGNNTKQKKLIPLLISKYTCGTKFELANNETREYLFVKRCAKLIVDNIMQKGIITLEGINILNTDLESMIKNIVSQNNILSQNKYHNELYLDLKYMINETSKTKQG